MNNVAQAPVILKSHGGRRYTLLLHPLQNDISRAPAQDLQPYNLRISVHTCSRLKQRSHGGRAS